MLNNRSRVTWPGLCDRAIIRQVQEKQLKWIKSRALTPAIVYRKAEVAPSPPSEFKLPFGGSLSPDNRWVKMAQVIPWSEFESEYAQNFPTEMGLRAKSFRMALGSLIIKEKLGISSE